MLGMKQMSTRKAELVAALLDIVAERGLEEVSVREVAAAAGVSIGTVQYYFPTKDDMLAAAFGDVVQRLRERMTARLGSDMRRNLTLVLRELLPIDARRATEVRIVLAFSIRAAISPDLAEIQRGVLTEVHDALATSFTLAGLPAEHSRTAAHVALAATDGLALHAVSSGGLLSGRAMSAALERLLDALLP